jgi:hypothetical protein
MSYASIARLAKDVSFQDRVKSCATIECQANLDNPDHPDWSNLAYDTLRGAPHVYDSFIRMTAQAPSVETAAGDPPDQSLLTDDLIQTVVTANYPIVASLWYNSDGTPWGGAYIPAPIEPEPTPPPVETTITEVSPTSSTTPANLSILGTGLTGTTAVTWSDVSLTNVTVVDDNTVTCVLPSTKKATDVLMVTVSGTVYTGPSFQAT